ncbi:Integrator complex subunit 4 [Trachymyrmex zeteki]|uniref:Integrator complex subunit 4 n=1 Tax=Mycetomoellerius zeteki TaxID=64791 RepID=A0A151WY23_9HYME|nr:Integrator complex subunit 4 [Trachymyrmex zeteki]
MKNRPPYSLKKFMKLYKIVQILANAWLIYDYINSGLFSTKLMCPTLDYSYNYIPMRMLMILLFVKNVETGIFVLRKKDNQVTTLHLYYHVSFTFQNTLEKAKIVNETAELLRNEESHRVKSQGLATLLKLGDYQRCVALILKIAQEHLPDTWHGVQTRCLSIIGRYLTANTADDTLTLIGNCVRSQDPRIHAQAFEIMAELHSHRGCRLPATFFKEACYIVGSDGEDVRMVDCAFSQICSLMGDLSPRVRASAMSFLRTMKLYIRCLLLLKSVLSKNVLCLRQHSISANPVPNTNNNIFVLQHIQKRLFNGLDENDIILANDMWLKALAIELVRVTESATGSALPLARYFLPKADALPQDTSRLPPFSRALVLQIPTLADMKPGSLMRLLLPLLLTPVVQGEERLPRPSATTRFCRAHIEEPRGDADAALKFTDGLLLGISLNAKILNLRDSSTLRIKLRHPDQQMQLLLPRQICVCVSENIDAVQKLIMQDRHLTYCEIETILGISSTSIYKILHDHLAVKKVCSRWIPHNLTKSQKDARVD